MTIQNQLINDRSFLSDGKIETTSRIQTKKTKASINLEGRIIKKVLLVYPNQRWLKKDMTTTWNPTPYSICQLASMIRDKVEVKLLDAHFDDNSRQEFKEYINKFKPDLVGISQLSTEYKAILDMAAEDIKEVSKNIITIAGGVHVTVEYDDVMKNPNIDFACHGEGEYVLKDFIESINENKSLPEIGIISRNSKGELKVGKRGIVDNLDDLPDPSFDLIDFKKYMMTPQRYGIDSPDRLPFVRYATSRGCPVGCTFCQVEFISGAKVRTISPENVVRQLKDLKQKYGIKSYHFEDDNAFFYRKRTKELLRLMIKEKLDLTWKATGVFLPTLDEEVYQLMQASGGKMLNIAIESGTERIMKKVIKKPINLETAPKSIALAQKYGLYIATNFIIGSPTETWDEIRQTIQYAENCGSDYSKFYLATPLTGTEMYNFAMEVDAVENLDITVDQRYSVMKGPDWQAKDLNCLRVYEWDRINFTDPKKRKKTAEMMGLTIEELEKLRKDTRDALTFDNTHYSQNE